MEKNIFLVIIAHNNAEAVAQQLEQLLFYKQRNVSVVVLDNGSTDNIAQIVKTHFAGVRVIESKAALTFAKAINVAAQFALTNRATHVIFLSPLLDIKGNIATGLF